MSAAEREKELTEALDAALCVAPDEASRKLVVNAIDRALHLDSTLYDVAAKWVRRRR